VIVKTAGLPGGFFFVGRTSGSQNRFEPRSIHALFSFTETQRDALLTGVFSHFGGFAVKQSQRLVNAALQAI
jgi:hypothetical protein